MFLTRVFISPHSVKIDFCQILKRVYKSPPLPPCLVRGPLIFTVYLREMPEGGVSGKVSIYGLVIQCSHMRSLNSNAFRRSRRISFRPLDGGGRSVIRSQVKRYSSSSSFSVVHPVINCQGFSAEKSKPGTKADEENVANFL